MSIATTGPGEIEHVGNPAGDRFRRLPTAVAEWRACPAAIKREQLLIVEPGPPTKTPTRSPRRRSLG